MSWTQKDLDKIVAKGLKVDNIKSIEIELKSKPKIEKISIEKKTMKTKKQQPEYQLQVAISNYISTAYPDVLFMSDTVASLKLTIPQSVRNSKIQKKGFKTPDLLVLKPNSAYHGLFIELKIETPFKQDGSLKKSEHLEAQQKTINDLNELGYFACFSWGFEKTKRIIDDYLISNKKTSMREHRGKTEV